MSGHSATDSSLPIIGAIRSMLAANARQAREEPTQPVPFVTISRQVGAGGWSLAQRLVEVIHERSPQEPHWMAYDRNLVERVAADHALSERLIESLEKSAHTWLDEVLAGLPGESQPALSEMAIYRRVAETIRALAQAGRAVIVGRGGVYITRGMPGGLHVRLIAPLDFRIDEYARRFQMPRAEAAIRVRELDQNRQAFYRRHWPREILSELRFAMTLNAAMLSESAMAAAIASALPLAAKS